MIEVFHNSEFLKYLLDSSMETLQKGQFESVGKVHTDSLEEAYMLTQNMELPWHVNTNVSANKRSCRSTSVGDILLHDKDYYVVESCGFKRITEDIRDQIPVKNMEALG